MVAVLYVFRTLVDDDIRSTRDASATEGHHSARLHTNPNPPASVVAGNGDRVASPTRSMARSA
jgi:hypothetical protein